HLRLPIELLIDALPRQTPPGSIAGVVGVVVVDGSTDLVVGWRMGKWQGREWVKHWEASLPEELPRARRSILRKAAETFSKLEPGLQLTKILAFDPGEPRCSFAVSVAFDYPHFAKSEVSVAATLIIPATCRAA